MLIAFSPNVEARYDGSRRIRQESPPIRDEAPVDPEGSLDRGQGRSEARQRAGRLAGAMAAACWLGLVAYYLWFSGPTRAGRLGPELVALLTLAGSAFVLAALAHQAAARSERRALERRSQALLDLLERAGPAGRVRSPRPGDRGPTVH